MIKKISSFFTPTYCLICDEPISEDIGWRALFKGTPDRVICQACAAKFQRITGDRCTICSRPLAAVAAEYRHGDTCYDCVRWEANPDWAGVLQENDSLFLYDAFATDIIARFKFRGDYILAFAFKDMVNEALAKQTYDILVPIPLSAERLHTRGFNQSEALLQAANIPFQRLLTRRHTEKQSKKSRQERLSQSDVFTVVTPGAVPGKHILLIDDIYTTGTTLHQAAKQLKTAGAQSVRAITLARG